MSINFIIIFCLQTRVDDDFSHISVEHHRSKMKINSSKNKNDECFDVVLMWSSVASGVLDADDFKGGNFILSMIKSINFQTTKTLKLCKFVWGSLKCNWKRKSFDQLKNYQSHWDLIRTALNLTSFIVDNSRELSQISPPSVWIALNTKSTLRDDESMRWLHQIAIIIHLSGLLFINTFLKHLFQTLRLEFNSKIQF